MNKLTNEDQAMVLEFERRVQASRNKSTNLLDISQDHSRIKQNEPKGHGMWEESSNPYLNQISGRVLREKGNWADEQEDQNDSERFLEEDRIRIAKKGESPYKIKGIGQKNPPLYYGLDNYYSAQIDDYLERNQRPQMRTTPLKIQQSISTLEGISPMKDLHRILKPPQDRIKLDDFRSLEHQHEQTRSISYHKRNSDLSKRKHITIRDVLQNASLVVKPTTAPLTNRSRASKKENERSMQYHSKKRPNVQPQIPAKQEKAGELSLNETMARIFKKINSSYHESRYFLTIVEKHAKLSKPFFNDLQAYLLSRNDGKVLEQ